MITPDQCILPHKERKQQRTPAEEAKAAEEKASAEKKAQVPVWEKPVENTSSKKAKMATTEETFDDFKEFL